MIVSVCVGFVFVEFEGWLSGDLIFIPQGMIPESPQPFIILHSKNSKVRNNYSKTTPLSHAPKLPHFVNYKKYLT